MLAARANDGRYGPYRFAEIGRDRPVPVQADRPPIGQPVRLGRPGQAVPAGEPGAVPHGGAERADERRLHQGLQRGEGARRQDRQRAHPGAGGVAQFHNLNPVELLNRTFRTLAVEKKLTLVEQARLFAMLSMTNADSLITCWADKGHWSFWRPNTAIRRRIATATRTPPPTRRGRRCSRPRLPGSPVRIQLCGGRVHARRQSLLRHGRDGLQPRQDRAGRADVTRNYARFSDVINEAIDVRIYHGVHFRTADVQGAQLGQNVAEWIAARSSSRRPPRLGLPNTGAGGGGGHLPVGWLMLALTARSSPARRRAPAPRRAPGLTADGGVEDRTIADPPGAGHVPLGVVGAAADDHAVLAAGVLGKPFSPRPCLPPSGGRRPGGARPASPPPGRVLRRRTQPKKPWVVFMGLAPVRPYRLDPAWACGCNGGHASAAGLALAAAR